MSSSTGTTRLSRACHACRIAKVRCVGLDVRAVCDRCRSAAIPCVLLPTRRGRVKGSKNRKTLEILRQAGESSAGLRQHSGGGFGGTESRTRNAASGSDTIDLIWTRPSTPESSEPPGVLGTRRNVLARLDESFPTSRETGIDHGTSLGQFYEKDIEKDIQNPLFFLAECARRRWGAEATPSLIPPSVNTLPSVDEQLLNQWDSGLLEQILQNQRVFFQHGLYGSKRDVGVGLDAVQRGIIPESDVEELFTGYYRYCHPQWPLLDPLLHTPSFTRTHSAYLFTTVLTTGATAIGMLPGATVPQCNRARALHAYVEKIQLVVSATAAKSREIIQAELMMQCWTLRKARLVDGQAYARGGFMGRMASSIGLGHSNRPSNGPLAKSDLRLRVALILNESRWESISDRKTVSPELRELSRNEAERLAESSPFHSDAIFAADYALHRFELESKDRLQRCSADSTTALDCEKVWITTFLAAWEKRWISPHTDPLIRWFYQYHCLRSQMVGLLRIASAQGGRWSSSMRQDLLNVATQLLEGALSHDLALHMLRMTSPLVFACTIILQSTGSLHPGRDLVLRIALRLAGNPTHDLMTYPKHNGYQLLNMICLSKETLEKGQSMTSDMAGTHIPPSEPAMPVLPMGTTDEPRDWSDLEQLLSYSGHIDFPFYPDSHMDLSHTALTPTVGYTSYQGNVMGASGEPGPQSMWTDVSVGDDGSTITLPHMGNAGGMTHFYSYVAAAMGFDPSGRDGQMIRQ